MEAMLEDGAAMVWPVRRDNGHGAALACLMNELGHGILLIAAGDRLLHANAAARTELARRGLPVTPEALARCLLPESRKALQEALRKAGDGKRSLFSLAGPQGAPLPVAVVPVKPCGEAEPAQAALVFARPLVCDSVMLGFFARSQGLTGAEEQVLGILCQGYSAPDAARLLNVAVSTVRSHVRSLCAKTRSSGVRELVGRLAVLPPVAPAAADASVH